MWRRKFLLSYDLNSFYLRCKMYTMMFHAYLFDNYFVLNFEAKDTKIYSSNNNTRFLFQHSFHRFVLNNTLHIVFLAFLC